MKEILPVDSTPATKSDAQILPHSPAHAIVRIRPNCCNPNLRFSQTARLSDASHIVAIIAAKENSAA